MYTDQFNKKLDELIQAMFKYGLHHGQQGFTKQNEIFNDELVAIARIKKQIDELYRQSWVCDCYTPSDEPCIKMFRD